jgi:hypothetical protein
MIAKPISGGRLERTTHPLWKYRLADQFIMWTEKKMPPVRFESAKGFIIGTWIDHELTINDDYMLDGASFWPDHEKGMRGFTGHDFGYQLAQILTRIEWDQLMLSIQAHDQYKLRHIVYAGVRVGGWRSYGKRDYVKIILL